eukprot:scaffold7856_cov72-Skeletonema_dohrnii-CCMP3373.AAC.6
MDYNSCSLHSASMQRQLFRNLILCSSNNGSWGARKKKVYYNRGSYSHSAGALIGGITDGQNFE